MKTALHTTLTSLVALGLTALTSQADVITTIFTTSTNGNAAALDGAAAGTTTPLTLDGGGTIDLTTSFIKASGSNAEALFMDGDSMGVTNDRWGVTGGTPNGQTWEFSFDQEVDFLGLGFKSVSNAGTMSLSSTAWAGEAGTSGTGWTFSSTGSEGAFVVSVPSGGAITAFDFSSAGVSSIAADTTIQIQHSGVAGHNGIEMTSFTIATTAIPEPSALALLLVGAGILFRFRKNENSC